MTSTRRPSAPEPLPWWLLGPVAVAGGLALAAAFEPLAAWPLALAAVAALAWVVDRAEGVRTATGLGLMFGLALTAPALAWQADLILEAYLGLVALETFYYGGLGAALWAVRGWGRWAPVAQAGVWTLVELVFSSWPFDGFGWLRLGHAMVDSPLAGWYPFVGAGVVTFLVALVSHAAYAAARARDTASVVTVVGVTVLALAGGVLGLGWLPATPASGTVTVGYVQGGADGGGIYGLGSARTTTYRHAAETDRLFRRVEAGELRRPDFVAMPENTTDMDPSLDAETRRVVEGFVARAGVPVLVGSPVAGPGPGERRTAALWWTPDTGPTAVYYKQNLVPFGEWIPFRDVFLPWVPALAYIGDQSIPGTEPGALGVTLPDGRRVTVGIAICYEVAFPGTFRDALDAGAQVMVVSSNNAMFAGTAQIDQQFAITRVRAAELRRQVLVVTNSGITGLIGERGEVLVREPDGVAASGVATMPLTGARTPFAAGGWLVERLIAVTAAAALAASVVRARRLGRAGQWAQAAPAASAPPGS